MTEAMLLQQLDQLNGHGFSKSSALVAEFMLSMPSLSKPTRFVALCKFADALYSNTEYTRAKAYYNQALLQKRGLGAGAGRGGPTVADIKHSLHNCLIHLGEHQEALTILSSVPTGSRSVEINMALGRLYARLGVTASAVQCFAAVVAACPMALDAVQQMIALGADVGSVIDALAAAGLGQEATDWLKLWVRGHQLAHRKEYHAATKPFVDLQRAMPDNAHVLVNLAEWQWKQGYLPVGKMAFEKARACDPHMMDKMDVYAHVLVAQGHEAELNRLCASLMAIDRGRVETWLALARYYQLLCENTPDEATATKHAKQGLLFVDKAAAISTHHAELRMVKGTLLLALDEPRTASFEFRQAYRDSKDFAAYQGLVSCYIAENRLNEALTIAKEGQQNMPTNPRAITLLGVVLKRYIDGNTKARKLFEKALAVSGDCMDSVFALFELELEETNYDAAITLLSSHLNHSRADYVHRRLADAYLLNGDVDNALKNYHLALSVNPDYEPAKEGIAQAMKELNSNGAEEAEEAEGAEEQDAVYSGNDDDDDDIPQTP